MKVIFLEDVPKVANAGDTKVVADGYARNYLLPRKLAVIANSSASNVVEARLKARERRLAKLEEETVALAKLIDGKEFVIKAKSGGKEKLYGSITAEDIAAELTKATGTEIDKRKVELGEAIHQLGTYDVPVRLGKDIVPTIKVTVTPIEESTDSASGQATPA